MKLLIISHNPITSFDAMGKTFLSLFSSFQKEDLCQLYIYPTVPDIDKCSSYFRITDKDVLKSYFKFKVHGKEITTDQINKNNHSLFENKNDEAVYRNRKNKRPCRVLLRDIMWKCAHWYNKPLCDWLQKQQPTHIFVAPGSAKFLYDIALKISKKFHLPIITYICDDYYFVEKSNTLLGKIQQNQLKRKTEQLMGKTSQIITICDELKDIYSQYFQRPAQTIMTGSSFPIATSVCEKKSISSLTYMGNIRCNRYLSLAQIGRALDKLNAENGTNFQLNIYTAEKDGEILKTFDGIRSIQLCGFISGETFIKTLCSADVLVHTEAFDKKSIDAVKHSVSTKIADSLSSGTCLFAYGPQNVASIQHLIRNDCAVICNAEEDLLRILRTLFLDTSLRQKTTENALRTAYTYHDSTISSKYLYDIIEKVSL